MKYMHFPSQYAVFFLSNIIDLVDNFLPFHLSRQWCISNIQLPLWSTKLSSNVIKRDERKCLAFVSTRRIRQYKSSSLLSFFCTSNIIHLKSQHSFLSRLVILFHIHKSTNSPQWLLPLTVHYITATSNVFRPNTGG